MKKLLRILVKTILILILLAGMHEALQPLSFWGKISLYNHLFPGRERYPFGESPQTAYNFSLNNLDAMTASHKISAAGTRKPDRIRIILIGDSSSWGILLRPEETLAGRLDGASLCGGTKKLEVYNLAYPTLSLSKDLLLLNEGMKFDPDLVIWPMTLESFPKDKQLASALTEKNPDLLLKVAGKSGLKADWLPQPAAKNLKERSLFAQRRDLADIFRLQLYGVMWAATGIDQDYPQDYPAAQVDLTNENTYHGYTGALPDDALAWDVLDAAHTLAGETPILMINEPMLISSGQNSNIRYNFYYPREAYDAWLAELKDKAADKGWNLADYKDLLPVSAFTNSAIHYDAASAEILAEKIQPEIEKLICR